MKHKSPDYKLSAVNYYLNHDVGYDNTCKIFDCKKSSLTLLSMDLFVVRTDAVIGIEM